jgi:DNA-binding GntR family transcriptional regulator
MVYGSTVHLPACKNQCTERDVMMEQTAAELAASEIRRLITTGQLVAGQPLREEELSERLGMSRTPLREAFARLKAEGIVVSDRSRSAVVFKPSSSDLREIYDIRIALESLAARLGAEEAMPSDVAELERIYRELDVVPPGRKWVRLNREFHMGLYALAARPRLVGLIETLRAQSEPYVRMLVAVGHGHEAQEGHREMLEAARAGDGAAAADAVERHLALTVTNVMSELEDGEV